MAYGLQVRKHNALLFGYLIEGSLGCGEEVNFSKKSRTLEILTNQRPYFLHLLRRKTGFQNRGILIDSIFFYKLMTFFI